MLRRRRKELLPQSARGGRARPYWQLLKYQDQLLSRLRKIGVLLMWSGTAYMVRTRRLKLRSQSARGGRARPSRQLLKYQDHMLSRLRLIGVLLTGSGTAYKHLCALTKRVPLVPHKLAAAITMDASTIFPAARLRRFY